MTATDNATQSSTQPEQDVLLSLRPQYQWTQRGSGLSIESVVAADMIASAKGARPNRILPSGVATAQLNVVDRVLRVDGDASVSQVEQDIFGARVEGASSLRRQTVSNTRLAPVVELEGPGGGFFNARVEAARTNYFGNDEADSATDSGQVRLGLLPRPIGGGLEWSRDRTRYGGVGAGELRSQRLVGLLNGVVLDSVLMGILAGRERSELGGMSENDPVYGLTVDWAPGPRTVLSGSAFKRYFGRGGKLNLRHRNPTMSFNIGIAREPVVAAAGLGGDGGLAGFLDAILTTRTPDPDQRQALVGNILNARAAEPGLLGPIGITAEYPQLDSRAQFGWVYFSTRTTISVSVYARQLERIQRAGVSSAAVPTTADSRQRGGSAEWNRRLTEQLSLTLGAQRSQVEGLALRLGEHTRDSGFRASLTRNLSPYTNASVGLNVRRVTTNARDVESFDETAAFVGLSHRF